MSLFRRSQEKRPYKKSNASWVYMETPDTVFMDSTKENGSTAVVQLSSNGFSSPDSNDKLPVVHRDDDQKWSGKNEHRGGKVRKCLCDNLLTLMTLLGVMVGIGLGFVLRFSRTWSAREIMYVNFPGEVFLNMLKCLILPLIVSSLVAAIGSLDTKISGKIGIRAVSYYLLTTVLAIILGIILVVTIRPGAGNPENFPPSKMGEAKPTLPEDTLMDLVRNMFPPNIMEATMTQFATVLEMPKNWTKPNNETTNEEMKAWKISQEPRQQINILGVVVFSIVVGITLAKMKRKGKPLLEMFICLSEAMMIITKVVIWLSPVGILFLVASKIMEMQDLSVIVGQIGYYTLTVLAGIFLHGFLVLPLIYFVIVRKNPVTFILNMGQALATAFGTSSSSATLPVTIACLEENNHIDPRVSRFCLPIGATINMDGTALYEAVAAIFIAQVRGRNLSLGNIVAISITSTAASIGAAGIPQAGLVTMVMVLNVVGLPAEDVTLILIVDWILDRFRTVVNVLGDAIGAAIVGHMSEKDLADISDNLSNNLEMTTL